MALACPALLGTLAKAQMMRQEVTTSDGATLSLLVSNLDANAPARPRLLFVPGWCMPGSIWRLQWPALAGLWPWAALDPRGQGQSSITPPGYHIERRVKDLKEVIDQIGPVVVVAWSLGVLEMLEFVNRYGTGSLKGLMLVDNSIGEPPVPTGKGHFLADLQRERVATLDHFIRTMFAHPPDAALLDDIRTSALQMPLQASLDLLSYPFPREHWRSIVHRVDCPLAYIVTSRFAEQSVHLHQARPDARVEVFAGAGHALFVDEAPRFNQVLKDWLSQLASPSGTRSR